MPSTQHPCTPASLPACNPPPPKKTQLSAAVSRKEKGNAAYKAGKLYRAVKQYTAAYETANSINERDMAPHPSAPSSSGGEAEGAEQQGGLSNAQILAQVGATLSRQA
jgi:hypothetical protein